MNIFVRKGICKAFITCTVFTSDITVSITANSQTRDGVKKSKRFSKKFTENSKNTVNTVGTLICVRIDDVLTPASHRFFP